MRAIILVLLVSRAFGAVAFVSSNICSSTNTTVALQTCSLAVTAGNQLFVSATSGTASTTLTISDGGTNTYTQILGSSTTVGSLYTWLVSSLATTATITVTVTPNVTAYMAVDMEQVSGASGVVDVSHADPSLVGTVVSTTKVATCSAFTTLTANDYIYGAGSIRNQTSNVTTITFDLTDDTIHPGQTGVGNRLAYGHQLTTSTVTITPTFTCTPSGNCTGSGNLCHLIAIKVAGGTPAPARHRIISQ